MGARLVAEYTIYGFDVCAFFNDKEDIESEVNSVIPDAMGAIRWSQIKQDLYIRSCPECGSFDIEYNEDIGKAFCCDCTLSRVPIETKAYPRWRWRG